MTFVRKVLSTTMKVWVMAGTSSSSTTDHVAIQSLIVFEVTHLSGNNGNLFGNNRSIWGEILNRIIGRIIWTGLIETPL